MTCYSPLDAYKSLVDKTESGKAVIAFDRKEVNGKPFEKIRLPCGSCIGCRIDRSKSWAIRCVHEAAGFDYNCFLTLTYNDECLPPGGSLDKSAFVNFMKRLRKRFQGMEVVHDEKGIPSKPIRFFHCGEYGEELQRPHHHACLFNFDFPDKTLWKEREGVRLYQSDILDEIWSVPVCKDELWKFPADICFERSGKFYVKLGYCLIGEVTMQSAAYVARYIMKKVNGEPAFDRYVNQDTIDFETGECEMLEPEYCTMSRRPGIGKRWFDEYGYSDCMVKDFVTFKGKRFKTPKYYDKLFDSVDPVAMSELKYSRKRKAVSNPNEMTGERLSVKEKVCKSRIKRLLRSYEHEVAHV